MAGETPRATQAQKEREARRRKLLSQSIPRTADDAYYRGSARSTIQGTITRADSKGRPGEQPKPAVKPRVRQADLLVSADSAYYANAVKQDPTPEAVAAAKARAKTSVGTKAIIPITESAKEYDQAAIGTDPLGNAIFLALASGSNVVTVYTAQDLKRAKARIDSLVTRELLDEEVARGMNVVLSTLVPDLVISVTETPARDMTQPAIEVAAEPSIEAPVAESPVTESAELGWEDFMTTTTSTEEKSEPEVSADFLSEPEKDPLLSVTSEPEPAVEAEAPKPEAPVETEATKSEAPVQPGRRKGRGTR